MQNRATLGPTPQVLYLWKQQLGDHTIKIALSVQNFKGGNDSPALLYFIDLHTSNVHVTNQICTAY